MNMNLPETWRRAAKIKTFILGFSYKSFQNVVLVLPTLYEQLCRLDPSLHNSVAAYKRDFFGLWQARIQVGLEGLNPKSDSEI